MGTPVHRAAGGARTGADTAGLAEFAESAHGGISGVGGGVWRDPSRPVAERVGDLLGRLSLEEKLAQLASVWIDPDHDGAGVAPMHGEFAEETPPLAEVIRNGLGQLTRVLGTRPVAPDMGARTLARLQSDVVAASRFGIPAIAHEECLTGLATWTATAFPTPLAWGASFDPDLVGQMARAIGTSMRAVGVHQGLAPVLDVTRDARWGRTEETIGADPYLVGTIGAAYVAGLESTGVVATLKHFAGYSASRGGRNLAPVSMGSREFADVILPPFEMALRSGGARAVMHSYTDLDGMPAAADESLLTGLLRGELGFTGVVVADYYGVSFLEILHGVAAGPAEAAALALAAGVDVELPMVRCYGEPLAGAVRSGRVPESLVDRAVGRVLRLKCELGLLDPDWSPRPGGETAGAAETIDLDPPAARALARRLAEESVLLLANRAIGGDTGDVPALPLDPSARIAVVGPLAGDPLAFLGCYSFPRHVGGQYPGTDTGLAITPVLDALRAELPAARITHRPGCDVRSASTALIGEAVGAARDADVVVAVLGDQSGLFGRGTSGEGCDADTLRLPGVQEDLLRALVDTGVPVVLVAVTGRPYALGDLAPRLAAMVQAFLPGVEGGPAIAGVLSGRVNPSGRLPVEVPASPTALPAYLGARLAGRTEVSSVDPTPLYPFGHGLSYTTFGYSDLSVRRVADGYLVASTEVPTDGEVDIGCTVTNTGGRAGTEVVQLYLRDPVAQVVRPVRFLAGFARVALEPGRSARVTFRLHADRTAFHGRAGTRIVEPGLIEVEIGASSADPRLCGSFTLCGPERAVGPDRVLTTGVHLH
ncbi:MAG TPA: glycoside hydrolase family 3 N-terminal domain-containing protein [Mycobacteriales bacterium]|nr:glycoside hydrolase family 3 N-terminal domain-containing protein [Mycobacteriales bacterium]